MKKIVFICLAINTYVVAMNHSCPRQQETQFPHIPRSEEILDFQVFQRQHKKAEQIAEQIKAEIAALKKLERAKNSMPTSNTSAAS